MEGWNSKENINMIKNGMEKDRSLKTLSAFVMQYKGTIKQVKKQD